MTTEFTIGQHIGDYEILSILGLGGMGKVYKVRNVISDRVEAMKILLPDLSSHQNLADRFLREIRLLATLNHPHIAALRTALTFENQLVMIMEFVEGETLANRLARAPISSSEAVNFSDQILSALSYAHKQNIIHRDIKPANMMLTPQGVVKLMDFGIARSSTDVGALTSTGTTLGSLNYMPPEQVRGEAADARSDIYSYGVSLYEMLTGKLPFQGDSQYSLMNAHLKSDPPAPITLRKDLPAGLNEIILMAMAKEPGNRFQSAEAFRAALKSVPASGLASPRPLVAPPPSSKPSSATTLLDTPIKPQFPTPEVPAHEASSASRPPPQASPRSGTLPEAPAASPSSAAAASRRGLWLALGSLLGVGVLMAAGIYIPRHMRTHADPDKAVLPGESSAGSSNNSKQPADAAQPAVSVQTDKGSVTVDQQGGVSVQSPNGSVEIPGSSGASVPPAAQPPVETHPAKGNPKPARSNASKPSTTQDVALPPSGPTPEELAKLEDEADKLNVRGAAVTHSIETLRQQQQASGYNLRADISSAQERAQVYLTKGNAALQVHDTVTAQKFYDLAETELAKLEKFLNH